MASSGANILLSRRSQLAPSPAPYHFNMSTLLLRNGRVIDPSQNIDQKADLWLRTAAFSVSGRNRVRRTARSIVPE